MNTNFSFCCHFLNWKKSKILTNESYRDHILTSSISVCLWSLGSEGQHPELIHCFVILFCNISHWAFSPFLWDCGWRDAEAETGWQESKRRKTIEDVVNEDRQSRQRTVRWRQITGCGHLWRKSPKEEESANDNNVLTVYPSPVNFFLNTWHKK